MDQKMKLIEKKRGFTLAEVVVGVLILGLVITLLGRAVSDALSAYRMSYTEDKSLYALQEVRQQILRITSRSEVEEGGELEVPVLVERERDETTQTRLVRIRWEAEVKPTRLLNVYIIEASIRLQEDSGTDLREARYVVFRPNWDEDGEQERLEESKEEEFRERLSNRGLDLDGEQ